MIKLNIIDHVDQEGYPCPEREAVKREVSSLHDHYHFLMDNYIAFEYEADRPDQDGVTGEIHTKTFAVDYEYANELWRYEYQKFFRFKGTKINDTIFVFEKDIRLIKTTTNKRCVRDLNDEALQQFEANHAA